MKIRPHVVYQQAIQDALAGRLCDMAGTAEELTQAAQSSKEWKALAASRRLYIQGLIAGLTTERQDDVCA